MSVTVLYKRFTYLLPDTDSISYGDSNLLRSFLSVRLALSPCLWNTITTSPTQPRVSLSITNKSLSSDDSPLSPSATPPLSLPAQNSPSHNNRQVVSAKCVWMYGASVSEGLFLPWCPVNIFKSLRQTCIYISVICTLPRMLCTSNVDK